VLLADDMATDKLLATGARNIPKRRCAVEVTRSLDEAVLPVSKQARRIGVSTAAQCHRRY
jgi:hypothetical protein